MSFGYSVGDFALVVKLAFNVYERCRDSTYEFRDLGRDVGNAHIVLRSIHSFWEKEEEHSRPLLVPQRDELKEYAEHCANTLKEIEEIRTKHTDLESSSTFTRLKGKSKYIVADIINDFGSVRDKLQRHTGNLALFHTMLTSQVVKDVTSEQRETLEYLKQRADIMYHFVRTYQQFQDGEREEPAYSQALAQIGPAVDPADQTRLAIEAAKKELEREGIDKAALARHNELIKEWLETVILPIDEGEEKDDNPPPTNAKPILDAAKAEFAPDTANSEGIRNKDTKRTRSHDPPHPTRSVAEATSGGPSKLPAADLAGADGLERASSTSTHRSQHEAWKLQDSGDTKTFAIEMLAKILRSKYSPDVGIESFWLPSARAFHHLDITKRGWLSRRTVETLFTSATEHIKCPMQPNKIAEIIKLEDTKDNKSDLHIDIDEFFNISLQVRELVRLVYETGSQESELSRIASYWQTMAQRAPISGFWKAEERETPDKWTNKGLHRGKKYHIFVHTLGGDLPSGFAKNVTNALHLATKYCVEAGDEAIYAWQEELGKLPASGQSEVQQVLDTVQEVAALFHQFESDISKWDYHWLDSFIETAALVPLNAFDEYKDCPFHVALRLQQVLWQNLLPLLGVVWSLRACSHDSTSQNSPKLDRLRQMRLLDRTKSLIETASKDLGDETISDFRTTREYYLQWKNSLSSQVAKCWQNTVSLKHIEMQNHQVQHLKTRSFSVNLVLSHGRLSRNPFDRTPITCYLRLADRIDAFTYRDSKTSRSNNYSFEYIEVHKDTMIQVEFNLPENKHLGSITFRVGDVVDVARQAKVSAKTSLKGGSRAGLDVQYDITPNFSHLPTKMTSYLNEEDVAYLKTRELPIAPYAITQPLPIDWEVRRCAHIKDAVYFFNRKTSEPTAVLWIDSFYKLAPDAQIKPLPQGWKKTAKQGRVVFRDASGTEAEHAPNSEDTANFQQVLQLMPFADPDIYAKMNVEGTCVFASN